jgi:hypothetical protein
MRFPFHFYEMQFYRSINAWSVRAKIHWTLPAPCILSLLFIAVFAIGSPACSAAVIRSAHELRDEDHSKPGIIVAIAGIVAIAVSATAVPGIVVPGTAAQHAVRTHGRRLLLLRVHYNLFPESQRVRMLGKSYQRQHVVLIFFLRPFQ